MSLISVGKRIGDLDIRLGIPPSKPQFSVGDTNNRINSINASANRNSVFNQFRSGITQASGFARPTQFLVTIDGPKASMLNPAARNTIFSETQQTIRLDRSRRLVDLLKRNMQLRMDLFCSDVSIPTRTITDEVNEQYYGPSRSIGKNIQYDEVTLEFYTGIDFEERIFFEAWQNAIVDPVTNNVGYYDDYATPCMITITPLTKTFTAALANFNPTGDPTKDRDTIRASLGNTSGFSAYQVQMYEAWPKTINSTQFSYGAKDQILKISVIMKYRFFATSAWNYLASPSLVGDGVGTRNSRSEFRSDVEQVKGGFLDNLPFGSEIGRVGRQVYETVKRNLPIGRTTGGRVFPKGLPDPTIIRDILY